MRIAAISNSRIPSATANSIQAVKVCDALTQCGHEVLLIVPAEGRERAWDAMKQHYGVRHALHVEWLPSWRPLRRLDFVGHAQAVARRHRADLIYTWLPQTAALAAALGQPVVLEMHADVAGRFGAWWLRQFWRGSHPRRLLATTQALRKALERSSGRTFPATSVQIAPNGVDLERYAHVPSPGEARMELHLPERFTVGFTGHFYAGRGVDLLFDVARRLPQTNFLWVGGTREAVEAWGAKLKAVNQTNVTLTGFVENSRLPLYQAAADILVMPYGLTVSASSGQDIAEVINPMKMFEYMAARRPIITSDLAVIREVLDETRAVFCRADDVAAWTSAIMQLSSDALRRATLAENGRREVEKYTWVQRARRAVSDMEPQ